MDYYMTMTNKLTKFFRDTSNILNAEFSRSSSIKHAGEKGRNREFFINHFLKKAFPQKFVIETGEIIDSLQNTSQQCDIIIYDEEMPTFDFGASKSFLSGGVLAHIEVKSNLTNKDLNDVILKTNSVKNLERDIDQSMSFGDPPSKIFSCCFAYEGMEKETFKDKINKIYSLQDSYASNETIDIICVLNKYIMHKHFDPFTNKLRLEFLDSKEDSLMFFFKKLFLGMQKNWAGIARIDKYFGENLKVETF